VLMLHQMEIIIVMLISMEEYSVHKWIQLRPISMHTQRLHISATIKMQITGQPATEEDVVTTLIQVTVVYSDQEVVILIL
jgi:protein tyrosine phosphatase